MYPHPSHEHHPVRKEIRELAARLKEHGIELTPATIGPDYRFPEPIDLDGVSLSDAIIEMRHEGRPFTRTAER